MTTIARSDDLRRQNRRTVLAALRRGGAMSRTELSAETGLSHSTVTLITAALLDMGAVVEASPGEGSLPLARRGRPQVTLALNPAAASVGVVTLTLNRLSASVIDYAGNAAPERVRRLDTNAAGEADLRREATQLLDETLAASGVTGNLRHIVIAVQGVTDADGGTLIWSPVTSQAGLSVGAWFSDAFGVPATVANDCNMMAEGLRWRGAFPESPAFAAILLAHGIGMGLSISGRLFTGIRSSAAEFGHMCHDPDGPLCRCGRRGCIEAYAADYAIWRRARGLDPGTIPSEDLDRTAMASLAAEAKAGPGPARDAYAAAGAAIGSGLRSLYALLDPFPVAFIGSGVLAFDLMEPAIRAAVGANTVAMGGAHMRFTCHENEYPLIRDGALMTALTHIDNHVFGAIDAGAEALEATA